MWCNATDNGDDALGGGGNAPALVDQDEASGRLWHGPAPLDWAPASWDTRGIAAVSIASASEVREMCLCQPVPRAQLQQG